MAIHALLSIDEGKSLRDPTTFEVCPQVGDKIKYWKDGRELMEAIVKSLCHFQIESGFTLVVEAQTDNGVTESSLEIFG